MIANEPRKLGEMFTLQRGFDITKNEQSAGPYPVVSSSGINSYHNKYKVKAPGVVIGRKGTLGTAFYLESDYWPHDTSLWIKDFKGNNPKFLYYFLKALPLEKLDSGSANPTLNRNFVHLLESYIPELKSQIKIANVLTTLDKKIELNNKINTELEAMAKLIYDYWFVQFDFPDANGKPYKSSCGKMIYNEELKREIPDGWEVENLKNNSLTKLLKPKVKEFKGNKIYLATADVKNNTITFQAENISFSERPSRANMQPTKNSIWFAKMKNSKKVLYFSDYSDNFIDKYILSTGFAGLKCQENSLEYIWGFIDNDRFEFIKNQLSNGATQEAINNDSMVYIKLLIPKNNILDKYQQFTKNIFQKVYINQLENQKLTELRDWLLPMLMNGQVTVKDSP